MMGRRDYERPFRKQYVLHVLCKNALVYKLNAWFNDKPIGYIVLN